jgi:cytochrome b subunit of formate dehydrogenase
MSSQPRTYLRFPLSRRIEHIALMASFITLALTGLPQKYAASPISVSIVQALGGIENLRAIHHFTSIIVMFVIIYHLLVLGYKVFVLRTPWSMMLSIQDMKDALQALLYNIGIAKTYPRMGRYTFEEKFEYWAFVWGYTIMGITGFIMWNPITATTYLPGEFVPAAKAAHGGEAVLAVLAIIVWHMYGVNIKHYNRSIFTGKISEEEMLHEHPKELEDIQAGRAERMPEALILRKRQRIFYPIAAILTVAMLAGVYGYINAEETALKNIPPISTTIQPPSQTPQP